jgi:antitoxin component HigA of HigAB toxin-antitoxin module
MTRIFTHCGRCSQCISRRFATLASKYAESDPAEMYKVDLLVGERTKNIDLTLVESFVRSAADMKTMNEYQLLERFGEVSRVLRHLSPLTADDVAQGVVRLHQKHAIEVSTVIDSALSQHSTDFLEEKLPSTCALILAVPEKYKTAVVGQDQGNGRQRGSPPATAAEKGSAAPKVARSIGSDAAVDTLLKLKNQKGWTVEELARHVGTTARTLQTFIKRRTVRNSVFRTMAQRLGVSPEELLEGGSSNPE